MYAVDGAADAAGDQPIRWWDSGKLKKLARGGVSPVPDGALDASAAAAGSSGVYYLTDEQQADIGEIASKAMLVALEWSAEATTKPTLPAGINFFDPDDNIHRMLQVLHTQKSFDGIASFVRSPVAGSQARKEEASRLMSFHVFVKYLLQVWGTQYRIETPTSRGAHEKWFSTLETFFRLVGQADPKFGVRFQAIFLQLSRIPFDPHPKTSKRTEATATPMPEKAEAEDKGDDQAQQSQNPFSFVVEVLVSQMETILQSIENDDRIVFASEGDPLPPALETHLVDQLAPDLTLIVKTLKYRFGSEECSTAVIEKFGATLRLIGSSAPTGSDTAKLLMGKLALDLLLSPAGGKALSSVAFVAATEKLVGREELLARGKAHYATTRTAPPIHIEDRTISWIDFIVKNGTADGAPVAGLEAAEKVLSKSPSAFFSILLCRLCHRPLHAEGMISKKLTDDLAKSLGAAEHDLKPIEEIFSDRMGKPLEVIAAALPQLSGARTIARSQLTDTSAASVSPPASPSAGDAAKPVAIPELSAAHSILATAFQTALDMELDNSDHKAPANERVVDLLWYMHSIYSRRRRSKITFPVNFFTLYFAHFDVVDYVIRKVACDNAIACAGFFLPLLRTYGCDSLNAGSDVKLALALGASVSYATNYPSLCLAVYPTAGSVSVSHAHQEMKAFQLTVMDHPEFAQMVASLAFVLSEYWDRQKTSIVSAHSQASVAYAQAVFMGFVKFLSASAFVDKIVPVMHARLKTGATDKGAAKLFPAIQRALQMPIHAEEERSAEEEEEKQKKATGQSAAANSLLELFWAHEPSDVAEVNLLLRDHIKESVPSCHSTLFLAVRKSLQDMNSDMEDKRKVFSASLVSIVTECNKDEKKCGLLAAQLGCAIVQRSHLGSTQAAYCLEFLSALLRAGFNAFYEVITSTLTSLKRLIPHTPPLVAQAQIMLYRCLHERFTLPLVSKVAADKCSEADLKACRNLLKDHALRTKTQTATGAKKEPAHFIEQWLVDAAVATNESFRVHPAVGIEFKLQCRGFLGVFDRAAKQVDFLIKKETELQNRYHEVTCPPLDATHGSLLSLLEVYEGKPPLPKPSPKPPAPRTSASDNDRRLSGFRRPRTPPREERRGDVRERSPRLSERDRNRSDEGRRSERDRPSARQDDRSARKPDEGRTPRDDDRRGDRHRPSTAEVAGRDSKRDDRPRDRDRAPEPLPEKSRDGRRRDDGKDDRRPPAQPREERRRDDDREPDRQKRRLEVDRRDPPRKEDDRRAPMAGNRSGREPERRRTPEPQKREVKRDDRRPEQEKDPKRTFSVDKGKEESAASRKRPREEEDDRRRKDEDRNRRGGGGESAYREKGNASRGGGGRGGKDDKPRWR